MANDLLWTILKIRAEDDSKALLIARLIEEFKQHPKIYKVIVLLEKVFDTLIIITFVSIFISCIEKKLEMESFLLLKVLYVILPKIMDRVSFQVCI